METFFLESGTADATIDCISTAITNGKLNMQNLMSLGMDGPNVNKSVLKKIDANVKKMGRGGLVDIGSCSLHTLHNAFKAGCNIFGSDAISLMVKVYSWFHKSPVRQVFFVHSNRS